VAVSKEGLGDFMEACFQTKVLYSIEQLSFEAIPVKEDFHL
jgi:hypothetical protein